MQRRTFLIGSTLFISGSGTPHCHASESGRAASVSFGLMTDLHYADKSPRGSRHYRETLLKLEEASDAIQKEQPNFVIELGDFIDAAASVETEQKYLRTINRRFEPICEKRHYVLGNHCVDTLTKEEFLGEIGQEKSYYSFDEGNFHFVVLDSCFKGDGTPYQRKNFEWTDANLPEQELDWLREDLKATEKPTVVFAHQRLDVGNNHGVKNAPDARKILESNGKITAVFQGHSHQNDLKWISGIPYCTCVAMVEGSGASQNGYSVANLFPDGSLELRGFRKQANVALRDQQAIKK